MTKGQRDESVHDDCLIFRRSAFIQRIDNQKVWPQGIHSMFQLLVKQPIVLRLHISRGTNVDTANVRTELIKGCSVTFMLHRNTVRKRRQNLDGI